MADVNVKVLTPSNNFNLMTLDEVKLKLSIFDDSQDDLLNMLIANYSDVVATMCNRVFAKETVQETWRDLQGNRLFVSHYPIDEAQTIAIESPRGTSMVDYELEASSGKVQLYGSTSQPIQITYTGGYVLPGNAPNALKEAALILIREERAAQLRAATSGVRSLSHKESRVVFFDPLQHRTLGTEQITATVNSLLMHYVRLWV